MSLESNALLYETCLRELGRIARARGESAMAMAEMVAGFAWRQHPGRFADGALENLILARGRDLAPPLHSNEVPDMAGLTLHVASEVYPTGGHSRVLTKWIQRDKSCSHGLVLTRQSAPLPKYLSQIWESVGVRPVILDVNKSIESRALSLRAISKGVRRVVLHHHPDDPVPLLAFATEKTAPVILFNHAHFNFGLGTSIAELVVNTLPYYGRLSLERRAARQIEYMIGSSGLEPMSVEEVDKKAAKRALGLPAECSVALTVGNQLYYTPNDIYDFFRTTQNLLAQCKDLYVLFVGVSADFSCVPDALRSHGRVRFYGPVPNPRRYYQAADIHLESFPMPSLGAVTEAVSIGEAYPVPAYGETESIIRPDIPYWPWRARNEPEYLSQVRALLDDVRAARGVARDLRERIAEVDARFAGQFERLYGVADKVPLETSSIPVMDARAEMDDLVMAEVGGEQNLECIRSIPSRTLRLCCLGKAWAKGYLSTYRVAAEIRQLVAGG